MAAGTLKFQQNQATIIPKVIRSYKYHWTFCKFAGCSAWIRLAAASGCPAPSGAGTGD